MINGLGVLGWGVGGIEAEAAMLGQPISMLIPQVIGFRLDGELPEGATATDLVLTVTEMLREKGVVGKFVEFYGPGSRRLPLADRATLGNMSPEFGSTCAIFPIDAETLRYLEFTGRPAELVALVEAYAKEQGLFHDERRRGADVHDTLELDLGDVEPSLAGPKRPQDRVPLRARQEALPRRSSTGYVGDRRTRQDEAVAESFPASDPPASATPGATEPRASRPPTARRSRRPCARTAATPVTLADGTQTELDHGHVVIAAITSCTNTSNPSVMLGAGLLARNARARGLTTQAVGEDLARAGLEGRHRLPRARRPRRATSTRSASTSSATAARPASATPARCPRRSRRRSTSTTSPSARCSPATATSRAASTPT